MQIAMSGRAKPLTSARESASRCSPRTLRLACLGVAALTLAAGQVDSRSRPTRAVADDSLSVRVGLATDEAEATVEDRHGLQVIAAGQVIVERASEIVVRPAGTLVRPWTYRLQVAAMREPWQAQRTGADLERSTGLTPDLAFDAETGLTRVRLGAWHARPSAVAEQTRLKASGIDAWVIEEPGHIDGAGLEVVVGEASVVRTAGPRLRIRRLDGGPIAWRGSMYRGDLVVIVNRRGKLNVILDSDLEDYLRGVVPREMGPRIYDDLEALKAQAVAARSYVLHNLGEFEAEGFDVCATTRCQVFGGVAGEHPLTDRAIRDTAGLVLATDDGRPADTLYTATCGGHTENVETVFPDKEHAYLRGVPCVESGGVSIGRRSSWNRIESDAVDRLVGDLGSNPRQIGDSFYRLLERAGIPAAVDELGGFERDEVKRFLGSVLDLVADPVWLLGDRKPPEGASPLVRSLYRLASEEGRVTVAQLRRILYQTGEITDLIEGRWVGFFAGDEEDSQVVSDGAEHLVLPPTTSWHWQGVDERLKLAPGDPLHLVVVAGEPLAVLVPDRDRRSEAGAPPTKVWREFRSDRDLERMTSAEFPGFDYRTLHLGDRGVSGRLANLRLVDGNDGSRQLQGLAIRWFLDLPETWFTAERRAESRAGAGWMFTGRGWGHGVGMCQRGAYRMGLRGARFDEILKHYYTGLELGLYGQ